MESLQNVESFLSILRNELRILLLNLNRFQKVSNLFQVQQVMVGDQIFGIENWLKDIVSGNYKRGKNAAKVESAIFEKRM